MQDREAARVIPHAVGQHRRRRLRIAPFEQIQAHAQRLDRRATLRGYSPWKLRFIHRHDNTQCRPECKSDWADRFYDR